MESRASEALGLMLRADGDGVWAPLVLPWLKWRGSCSRGYVEMRGVVFFRHTSSGLPLERIL